MAFELETFETTPGFAQRCEHFNLNITGNSIIDIATTIRDIAGGDLPEAPGSSPHDFVLQSGNAAIWEPSPATVYTWGQ